MIITVTERGAFRRCRKQWDYTSFNRRNLKPVGAPTGPFNFGTMMHKALEEWSLHMDRDPRSIYIEVAKAEIESIKQGYRAQVGAEPQDEELQSVYENIEIGLDVIENYADYWGSPIPDGYTLIQPEQTVIVPIPGTSHQLEGTFDSLMVDQHGAYWVLERKTYGQRPRQQVLESADQFLAYLWMLRELGLGPVGGLYYDGMWKRKVEKKRTQEDIFMRTPLIRNEYELDRFAKHVANEVEDMHDPTIYPNRRWEGCHDCAFDRLCLAEERGEDADYIERTYYTQKELAEWRNLWEI